MRVLLLLYLSRSGSTFFASQVARQFSKVLVVPELRLPGLLVRHDIAASADPRQALLELVRQDHQFEALGMSAQDVEDCIERLQGQYSGEAVLREIAALLAARRALPTEAVMFKCGAAGRHWPELRERLGGVEFVHVLRDPRAAVNSAMRTARPYHPGQIMGRGDPWLQAQRWSRYVERMNRLRQEGRLLLQVRYEDLCGDPHRVMAEFGQALGLSADGEGVEFSVAASEESIHANIDRSALRDRSLAWQTEMPAAQGLVVEHVTRALRMPDYADYFTPRFNPLLRAVVLACAYGRHRWDLARYRAHRRRQRLAREG